jgi:predicted nucleotidyltransferase
MIREDKKLPKDAIRKIPEIVDIVSGDKDIVVLYTFGSLAKGDLKPMSDLDFAVLLTPRLSRKQRFDKHLKLIGIFNHVFRTDEIDLILLNDAPPRFVYRILKEGKILICKKQDEFIDFKEYVVKTYLDFKFFRDRFDRIFLEKVGYYG